MIHLADISKAQPLTAIDPDVLKQTVSGVYIRCGEGLNDSDRQIFLEQVNHLDPLHTGLRVGAYHVIAPSSGSPEKQAQNLLKWSAMGIQMMPYVVDVERNRPLGQDAKSWKGFLDLYCAELCRARVKFLVYTYDSFRQELEAAGFSADWFIARYPTLRYPTPEAEALRKNVLDWSAKSLQLGAGTDAWRKAIQAKQASALALSRRHEEPSPIGTSPQRCSAWQFGGDANSSTVAGIDGLCDRSYLYSDWGTFFA